MSISRDEPKAKAALHEIMNAENREVAEAATDRFQEDYAAWYPKATEKLLKDREALLAHFEYPAEHWIHLRMPAYAPRPRAGRTSRPLY